MASDNCKLQERVEQIDARVTRLEENMTTGFTAVTNAVTQTNEAVKQLATDFGSRMTNLDTRLIESKVKWGEWARASITAVGKWLGKWGGVIILAALGISNAKDIADLISRWSSP